METSANRNPKVMNQVERTLRPQFCKENRGIPSQIILKSCKTSMQQIYASHSHKKLELKIRKTSHMKGLLPERGGLRLISSPKPVLGCSAYKQEPNKRVELHH